MTDDKMADDVEVSAEEVEALKKQLVRRASRAVLGGFHPPADPFTSWFGKVNIALPGEDWPTSAATWPSSISGWLLTGRSSPKAEAMSPS